MEEDKNVSRDDSRREGGVWSASECRSCLCLMFGLNVGVVVVEVVIAEKSANVDNGAYNASLERVAILPVLPPSPSRLLVLAVLLINTQLGLIISYTNHDAYPPAFQPSYHNFEKFTFATWQSTDD